MNALNSKDHDNCIQGHQPYGYDILMLFERLIASGDSYFLALQTLQDISMCCVVLGKLEPLGVEAMFATW